MSKNHEYAICSLFTAFIAICSQLAIYIGEIPISFSMVSIYITGMILGTKKGFMSVLVYVLLGCVGIPVFAGGKGGMSVILGPTGGFILGYLICVITVGKLNEKNKYIRVISLISGLTECYIIGTIWYSYVMGVDLKVALKYCIIPFVPGDIIKIIITLVMYRAIKKRILTNFIKH